VVGVERLGATRTVHTFRHVGQRSRTSIERLYSAGLAQSSARLPAEFIVLGWASPSCSRRRAYTDSQKLQRLAKVASEAS